MNTGDTAFVLASTALVFFMTPGLALFYGGMVRRKNVLNTIMSSFFIVGLASVMWVLIGYSLSFGQDTGGVIGNLKWFGLNGVTWDPNSDYSATIPHNLFAAFQMMFAVITPALITGALVEQHPLFRFDHVYCSLVDHRLLSACPYDVGRGRNAERAWRCGFRGRQRGTYQFRCFRSRRFCYPR